MRTLKDILTKPPKDDYPEGSWGQRKAHAFTEMRDTKQEVREIRHEARSLDRWFMGAFVGYAVVLSTLHTNGVLDGINIWEAILAAAIVLLIAVAWVADKDYMFWELSDLYEILNIQQDEFPFHTSRARWHRKRQRGVFAIPARPKKGTSREKHSKKMVKANRLRFAFFKPLIFVTLSLVVIYLVAR